MGFIHDSTGVSDTDNATWKIVLSSDTSTLHKFTHVYVRLSVDPHDLLPSGYKFHRDEADFVTICKTKCTEVS